MDFLRALAIISRDDAFSGAPKEALYVIGHASVLPLLRCWQGLDPFFVDRYFLIKKQKLRNSTGKKEVVA